jgi:hypothetical protein
MALKTKITETFTVKADDGAEFQVQEHTQFEVTRKAGVTRELQGRSYLKTEDGRGVIKNHQQHLHDPQPRREGDPLKRRRLTALLCSGRPGRPDCSQPSGAGYAHSS